MYSSLGTRRLLGHLMDTTQVTSSGEQERNGQVACTCQWACMDRGLPKSGHRSEPCNQCKQAKVAEAPPDISTLLLPTTVFGAPLKPCLRTHQPSWCLSSPNKVYFSPCMNPKVRPHRPVTSGPAFRHAIGLR